MTGSVKNKNSTFFIVIECVVVLALISVHFTLAVTSKLHYSATYDEPYHITGGYSYWAFGDFRYHPENGNLPQRVIGLPVYCFLSCEPPNRDSDSWRVADLVLTGQEFLFDPRNDHYSILFAARCGNSVLSSILVFSIYLCSRSLFGIKGGLGSLFLATFCPNFLAHGGLATSDTCFALTALLSVWNIIHIIEKFTILRLLALALSVSACFLSKFSAPIIIVFAIPCAVLAIISNRPLEVKLRRSFKIESRPPKTLLFLSIMIATALFCWVTIWSFFDFRYSAFRTPGQFYGFGTIDGVTSEGGVSSGAIRIMESLRLLPEAYLYGAAFVYRMRERWGFVLGNYSLGGTPEFFPVCFLLKVPIPTLLLICSTIILGVLGAAKKGRGIAMWYAESRVYRVVGSLMLFLLLFWCMLINSTMNIGFRHALPTLPIIYILSGYAFSLIVIPSWLGILAIANSVFLAICTYSAFPEYVPYFNAIVSRGTEQEVLLDSNFDWGQDLPALRNTLAVLHSTYPNDPVYLDYFGSSIPKAYGVEAGPVEAFEPGIYCISATSLKRVYSGQKWTSQSESMLRFARSVLLEQSRLRKTGDPQERLKFNQQIFDEVSWVTEDLLRQKFYAGLERRLPDAMGGRTIFVFRLSDSDIDALLKK